jgi:hypothetical protein
VSRAVISLSFFENHHSGYIPAKLICFVSECWTATTPFIVLREEKSLPKVYEKKLIVCFVSICQAKIRTQQRIRFDADSSPLADCFVALHRNDSIASLHNANVAPTIRDRLWSRLAPHMRCARRHCLDATDCVMAVTRTLSESDTAARWGDF